MVLEKHKKYVYSKEIDDYYGKHHGDYLKLVNMVKAINKQDISLDTKLLLLFNVTQ